MLDPRKGKNVTFNENRAAGESFLRITAAAVKHSQPTPPPGPRRRGGNRGARGVTSFYCLEVQLETGEGIPQLMQRWT